MKLNNIWLKTRASSTLVKNSSLGILPDKPYPPGKSLCVMVKLFLLFPYEKHRKHFRAKILKAHQVFTKGSLKKNVARGGGTGLPKMVEGVPFLR